MILDTGAPAQTSEVLTQLDLVAAICVKTSEVLAAVI